jgi:amino acid permease
MLFYSIADMFQVAIFIMITIMIGYFSFRSAYIDMEDFDGWIIAFIVMISFYVVLEINEAMTKSAEAEESMSIGKRDLICESRTFPSGKYLIKNGDTVITEEGEEISIANLKCRFKD